jgi:hypothetical protein
MEYIMRKLFILLILATTFGCDPHFDAYVPRQLVGACSEEANGILADYKECLERHCVIQPDPILSNTPVYICDED